MYCDGNCHEAVEWYRPLEVFGRWQIHAERELLKGDDPRTDHRKGVHSHLPGWQPKETTAIAGYDCFDNATVEKSPDAAGRAPCVCKLAGYLPPGTVGQWRPATLQWRTESRAATRKPTRRGRLGPRAGIPKRKLPNCQRQKGTLGSAWAATTHCERKEPENPGVVAPLARRVVAATAGMLPVGDCFA